jgi:imidazolonepropionase-like amidohydrolase
MGSPSPAIFARPRSHASLAIAAALLLLLYPFYHFYSVRSPSSLLSPAQLSRFNAALAQCELLEREPYWAIPRSTPKNRVNPRYKASSTSSSIVILQNATVFDGEAWLGQVDVVITAGIISEIDEEASGRFRSSRTDVEIIDLEGKIVTPGLVDMHSHAGVDPLPNLRGSSDFNQVSSPLTPYARTIDAIHPDDLAIPMIAAGGVTTSLVLPGSANIIGGEAFAIKNVVPDDQLVESMLVEPWDEANRTRWMKMACGENPKGVYPKQTNTRMGLSWALRQHLARAKEVMARQQGWCERARSADERVRFGAEREVGEAERLAEELEFELTVAMLRGHVRVNTHCYETVDLETMLRHTHEFGFRIAAFHHALSAWKVTGLLKDQG